jgi:hypothetical protein
LFYLSSNTFFGDQSDQFQPAEAGSSRTLIVVEFRHGLLPENGGGHYSMVFKTRPRSKDRTLWWREVGFEE